MSKRAVAAALWFAAVWFGYEILWSVAGGSAWDRPGGRVRRCGLRHGGSDAGLLAANGQGPRHVR